MALTEGGKEAIYVAQFIAELQGLSENMEHTIDTTHFKDLNNDNPNTQYLGTGNPKDDTSTPPQTQTPVINIYVDNQCAITHARNPEFHTQNKHIGIQEHHIREKVTTGEIEFQYLLQDI